MGGWTGSEKRAKMTTIRLVTGHDGAGASTILSSGPLPGTDAFIHSPGFSAALVWSTEPLAQIEAQPVDPTLAPTSVLPAPGASTALLVTFPPENQVADVPFDPVAAATELCRRLPGLGELFEADAPGFHRTETIDYGVVLDGEITLELDGCTNVLRQGDIVIQIGTRHAWRNLGNTPARLLFVMIGAQRTSQAS